MDLPYANSRAGQAQEREIRDTLRSVGADAVGFMVDDSTRTVICQFRLHGRQITVPVSVASYEAAWRRSYPRGPRTSEADWVQKARAAAEIAVWVILADWVKAQAAMMAAGFLTTDSAFLPHIHTPDGRRVADVIASSGSNLLPPPVKA